MLILNLSCDEIHVLIVVPQVRYWTFEVVNNSQFETTRYVNYVLSC
jgi:hypothetical protein